SCVTAKTKTRSKNSSTEPTLASLPSFRSRRSDALDICFLGTEYGDLVLIKIALFIVLLSFGAANRYWLTPRLLPTDGATGEDNRSLGLLCASVSLEITLGLVVICVVAVLGQLPPPGHEHHMDPHSTRVRFFKPNLVR